MTRRVCASCSARCWWGSCLRNAFLPFPFLCLQLRHPTPSPQKCSLIPTKRLQLLVFQQVTKMNIYVLQRLQILFSLVNILLSVFCQQDNKGVKLPGGWGKWSVLFYFVSPRVIRLHPCIPNPVVPGHITSQAVPYMCISEKAKEALSINHWGSVYSSLGRVASLVSI